MRGKRENTYSLKYLGDQKLNNMLSEGKGTSKHADKLENKSAGLGSIPNSNKIYIDRTKNNYMKYWHDYCKSIKESGFKVDGHSPRDFSEAALYMPRYIEELKSRPGNKPGTTYSAWTIRTYFAGVAKVLGISAKDYNLPTRYGHDIIRSRGSAERDKHFSIENNKELIDFCCATGLRNKCELQKIKGDCLVKNEKGEYCIRVVGKGKKERLSPILGSPEQIARVVEKIQSAGDNLVWPHVHSAADIHNYRAQYARNYYNHLVNEHMLKANSERESLGLHPFKDASEYIRSLPRSEKYCCRGTRAGEWYDRKAVLEVSKFLGHSRENVIVEHYLDRKD